MNIAYLRDWPTNIGNTFIYLGAMQCLKNTFPKAKIHAYGGLGRRVLLASANTKFQNACHYYMHLIPILKSYFKKGTTSISTKHYKKIFQQTEESVRNFFDLSIGIEADYTIISGCILTHQLGFFSETLMSHKKRNRKIIFYAVGGDNYSEAEVERIEML